MNEHKVANTPNVLVLSLQKPASLFLSETRWDMTKDFTIAKLPVEGNDTPFVTLADLLVDPDRGWFAGLTWPIFDPIYREPMRRIAQRLDPRVVCYNDLSDPNATRSYPDAKGDPHWFEIIWSPSKNLKYECAQLCNGQWFWWYGTENVPTSSETIGQDTPSYFMPGSWGASPPVVALGLADIPDVLRDLGLGFPVGMNFPHLDFSVR